MMQWLAGLGISTYNRYAAALEHRDYRTMWLANASAQAAAWALIVSRAWFVYDETGMSSDVAIVTFAAMAPAFIVPAIAGVLADRLDRRTLLGYTYLLNLAANLVLALLAFTGMLEVWQVVLLSALNGVARYAAMPVSQALVPNLVPRDVLLNALSLNAATNHLSRLIGPGIVTPVLVLLGAPAAFLVCILFYLLSWWQVMQIKARSTGGAGSGGSFAGQFIAGVRYIASQPLIAMVTILVCFHCALTMAFESALPAFSNEVLRDPAGFGILMTAVGIGSSLGSIYIGGVRSALVRGRMMLVMGLLSGLGQVVLAFAPNLVLAWCAALVMGWTQAAFMTLGQAITQSLADDQFRGRIASVNTMSFQGLMALMNLVNGFFVDSFSASWVLMVNGAMFVGIMLLSFLVATPRRVYLSGIPAEAHAMPREWAPAASPAATRR